METAKQTEPNSADIPNIPEVESGLLVAPASEGDENKKRFKVGMIFVGADCLTIYANTPEEAIEFCQSGFGRHAGQEEPELIGIQCYEMTQNIKSKSFIKMFMGMVQSLQQQIAQMTGQVRGSGIVIPKLVAPPGVGRS